MRHTRLIVGLERTGSTDGKIDGYELRYHSNGTKYLLRTKSQVTLADSCGNS
jgi:hypothetical protein